MTNTPKTGNCCDRWVDDGDGRDDNGQKYDNDKNMGEEEDDKAEWKEKQWQHITEQN